MDEKEPASSKFGFMGGRGTMLTMLVARSTGTISSFWMDEKVQVSPNFRIPAGGVGALGATTTAMMLVAAARLVCARVHVLQRRGTSSASVMELSAMNGGGEIVSFGH
jgi:hypothetical protein